MCLSLADLLQGPMRALRVRKAIASEPWPFWSFDALSRQEQLIRTYRRNLELPDESPSWITGVPEKKVSGGNNRGDGDHLSA